MERLSVYIWATTKIPKEGKSALIHLQHKKLMNRMLITTKKSPLPRMLGVKRDLRQGENLPLFFFNCLLKKIIREWMKEVDRTSLSIKWSESRPPKQCFTLCQWWHALYWKPSNCSETVWNITTNSYKKLKMYL